jgi:hypothetical protein
MFRLYNYISYSLFSTKSNQKSEFRLKPIERSYYDSVNERNIIREDNNGK